MILTKDVFSEAYDAIRQNRRRSAITVLGMAWGIATVVLLLAYGTGFSTAIVNIFRSYASMQSVGVVGRADVDAGRRKQGRYECSLDQRMTLIVSWPTCRKSCGSPRNRFTNLPSATKDALTDGP